MHYEIKYSDFVKGEFTTPYNWVHCLNENCEIKKRCTRWHVIRKMKQIGYTIVPTLLFIDKNGRAKVDIALAKGKKEFDKRQTLKEKEDRREMDRAMKHF